MPLFTQKHLWVVKFVNRRAVGKTEILYLIIHLHNRGKHTSRQTNIYRYILSTQIWEKMHLPLFFASFWLLKIFHIIIKNYNNYFKTLFTVIALYGRLSKLKSLFIGRFWMINCISCLVHVKSPLLIHKFKCNGTIIQMQWYNIVEEI